MPFPFPKYILAYILAYISAICLVTSCFQDRKSGDKLYLEGMKHYYSYKLDKAEASFKKSIESDSSNLNTYLMLSKIMYFRKKYDQAAAYVDEILSRDVDNINGLYWKARIYLMKDSSKNVTVEKSLNRVLEINSHHLPARLLLALIYEQNGQNRKALNHYIAALANEEYIINAHLNLATLYRRMGFKNKAMVEIEKSEKISNAIGKAKGNVKLIKREIEKWSN